MVLHVFQCPDQKKSPPETSSPQEQRHLMCRGNCLWWGIREVGFFLDVQVFRRPVGNLPSLTLALKLSTNMLEVGACLESAATSPAVGGGMSRMTVAVGFLLLLAIPKKNF